jgi:hypothetical protein
MISVKASIRLFHSFDQDSTHQYQGYTLTLDGEVDGVMRNRFDAGTSPKT